MPFGVEDLVTALNLDTLELDRFRGNGPAIGRRRIFGGLVVAQALIATERTVDGRPAHALHGSFLRPGDPKVPIDYAVERLRDGGTFSSRRCLASQRGQVIFAMSASFHRSEDDALAHAQPMPDVPAPEALPSYRDIQSPTTAGVPAALRAYLSREAPVEIRPVDLARFAPSGLLPSTGRQEIWMRASGALPDDPEIHRAVLAYMSDLTLLDVALARHGRSVVEPDLQVASLDHAIWFHRSVRADDWLLYCEESPSAQGSRGFARGSIFARTGTLAASTAQEGLMRIRRSKVESFEEPTA